MLCLRQYVTEKVVAAPRDVPKTKSPLDARGHDVGLMGWRGSYTLENA